MNATISRDGDRLAEIAQLVAEQQRDDTSRIERERIGGTFTLSLDRMREDGFDVSTSQGDDGHMTDAERVRQAIDNLPEVQRDVINALFYERLSEAGLAERLGVSRALVRKRRDQALHTLSETLGFTLKVSA